MILRFIFKGKKLGSFFPIKDKISIKHEMNYHQQIIIKTDNTIKWIYPHTDEILQIED